MNKIIKLPIHGSMLNLLKGEQIKPNDETFNIVLDDCITLAKNRLNNNITEEDLKYSYAHLKILLPNIPNEVLFETVVITINELSEQLLLHDLINSKHIVIRSNYNSMTLMEINKDNSNE